MEKKHVSLKTMAEDKELDGVSKVTIFGVDPRLLKRAPSGTNRPINWGHVRTLADAYKRGATFPPLDVAVENGDVTPVDGQHRHEAALLAISEGAEVRAVECRQFRGNQEDMIFHQIGTQEGLKMSPIVLADRYRKLVSWGWKVEEIAERAGKSGQHVRDTLALADAPKAVQRMVEEGQVSADVARKTIKKHGADAGKVLAADLQAAKAAGKDKVTAKTASTQRPSKLATAMSLLERLREHVEALDGTSVENERLVDDFRAFMGVKNGNQ